MDVALSLVLVTLVSASTNGAFLSHSSKGGYFNENSQNHHEESFEEKSENSYSVSNEFGKDNFEDSSNFNAQTFGGRSPTHGGNYGASNRFVPHAPVENRNEFQPSWNKPTTSHVNRPHFNLVNPRHQMQDRLPQENANRIIPTSSRPLPDTFNRNPMLKVTEHNPVSAYGEQIENQNNHRNNPNSGNSLFSGIKSLLNAILPIKSQNENEPVIKTNFNKPHRRIEQIKPIIPVPNINNSPNNQVNNIVLPTQKDISDGRVAPFFSPSFNTNKPISLNSNIPTNQFTNDLLPTQNEMPNLGNRGTNPPGRSVIQSQRPIPNSNKPISLNANVPTNQFANDLLPSQNKLSNLGNQGPNIFDRSETPSLTPLTNSNKPISLNANVPTNQFTNDLIPSQNKMSNLGNQGPNIFDRSETPSSSSLPNSNKPIPQNFNGPTKQLTNEILPTQNKMPNLDNLGPNIFDRSETPSSSSLPNSNKPIPQNFNGPTKPLTNEILPTQNKMPNLDNLGPNIFDRSEIPSSSSLPNSNKPIPQNANGPTKPLTNEILPTQNKMPNLGNLGPNFFDRSVTPSSSSLPNSNKPIPQNFNGPTKPLTNEILPTQNKMPNLDNLGPNIFDRSETPSSSSLPNSNKPIPQNFNGPTKPLTNEILPTQNKMPNLDNLGPNIFDRSEIPSSSSLPNSNKPIPQNANGPTKPLTNEILPTQNKMPNLDNLGPNIFDRSVTPSSSSLPNSNKPIPQNVNGPTKQLTNEILPTQNKMPNLDNLGPNIFDRSETPSSSSLPNSNIPIPQNVNGPTKQLTNEILPTQNKMPNLDNLGPNIFDRSETPSSSSLPNSNKPIPQNVNGPTKPLTNEILPTQNKMPNLDNLGPNIFDRSVTPSSSPLLNSNKPILQNVNGPTKPLTNEILSTQNKMPNLDNLGPNIFDRSVTPSSSPLLNSNKPILQNVNGPTKPLTNEILPTQNKMPNLDNLGPNIFDRSVTPSSSPLLNSNKPNSLNVNDTSNQATNDILPIQNKVLVLDNLGSNILNRNMTPSLLPLPNSEKPILLNDIIPTKRVTNDILPTEIKTSNLYNQDPKISDKSVSPLLLSLPNSNKPISLNANDPTKQVTSDVLPSHYKFPNVDNLVPHTPDRNIVPSTSPTTGKDLFPNANMNQIVNNNSSPVISTTPEKKLNELLENSLMDRQAAFGIPDVTPVPAIVLTTLPPIKDIPGPASKDPQSSPQIANVVSPQPELLKSPFGGVTLQPSSPVIEKPSTLVNQVLMGPTTTPSGTLSPTFPLSQVAGPLNSSEILNTKPAVLLGTPEIALPSASSFSMLADSNKLPITSEIKQEPTTKLSNVSMTIPMNLSSVPPPTQTSANIIPSTPFVNGSVLKVPDASLISPTVATITNLSPPGDTISQTTDKTPSGMLVDPIPPAVIPDQLIEGTSGLILDKNSTTEDLSPAGSIAGTNNNIFPGDTPIASDLPSNKPNDELNTLQEVTDRSSSLEQSKLPASAHFSSFYPTNSIYSNRIPTVGAVDFFQFNMPLVTYDGMMSLIQNPPYYNNYMQYIFPF